jgi:hypothetical protein
MFALKSQLKGQILRSTIKSNAYRGLSTSSTRFGGHDDHHDHFAPEEKLADNPLYIGAFLGILGCSAGLAFENYYKKFYGESYFAQWISPAPAEEIVNANTAYQEKTIKDSQVYEVMYMQPVSSPFRDLETVQPIRRGSSFNREPGTSLNIDTLAPRREIKRSIFD